MPDIISHWLLGRRICKDSAFADLFPEINEAAFLWGCQGPDILFYHRNLPWQSGSLRSYGSAVHRSDPAKLLRSLGKVCRYCMGRQDFVLIYSYALGFCCHYCYDRTIHPLVHYNMELLEKTDEHGKNYNYHALIESNYDLMLLRHDTGMTVGELDLKDCLPECKGIDTAAAVVYSLLLCDMFGVHTPREAAVTLAGDFRANIALRNDSHSVKKQLAEWAEKLLPYVRPGTRGGALSCRFHPKEEDTSFDYGNMTGSVWFEPQDRSVRSNLNFYELTDRAQVEAMQLMELFSDEIEQRGSANFDLFTKGLTFGGLRWEP